MANRAGLCNFVSMIIQMNYKGQTTESRVISFLRFPLVLLVLFAYCDFGSFSQSFAAQTITAGIADFISKTIAPVCFNAFFFISGMLFFHEDKFNKDIYFGKLKSRCRSLLVPYIAWNALLLLMLFLTKDITGKPFTFGTSIADIVTTTDNPLWVIRDIILLSILSPVVYLAIKYYSKMHIYVQTGLLMPLFYCIDKSGWWPQWLATPAVFFAIGAYFSINHIDICKVFRRMDVAFLMSVIVAFYYGYANTAYLLMIFLAFCWLGKKTEQGKLPTETMFERASFFIFAYQCIPLGLIVYLVKCGILVFNSEIIALACYIGSPVVIAIIGVFLYSITDRFLPHLSDILNGDR